MSVPFEEELPADADVVTAVSFNAGTLTLTKELGDNLTTSIATGGVPSEFVGWYAYQSGGSTSLNHVVDFPFETTRMNYESMFTSNTRATIPTGLGGNGRLVLM